MAKREGTPKGDKRSTDPDPDGNLGATEDQVDMKRTVPERIDKHGSKVEEIGGTGEHDSLGG
ncbi:MAG TPA: hypothetical protein VKT49_00950 [Bryobacteraceae bacterium]|nr:hypothetical protein [Bryobacteraceae bacterium]